MRNGISFLALGATLMAGTSLALAQPVETIVAPAPGPGFVAPAAVATVPIQTVRTVRTVETMAPRTTTRRVVHHRNGNRVVTTRTTTVRQGFVEAPAVASYNELVAGQPLYDVVPPAPIGVPAPVPLPAAPPLVETAAPVIAAPPAYQYVYEPGRILVIDPYSGIAVQSIPR